MKKLYLLAILVLVFGFLNGCIINKDTQKDISDVLPDNVKDISKDPTSKTSGVTETKETEKTKNKTPTTSEERLQLAPNTVVIVYSANLGKETTGVSNFDVSSGEVRTYIGTGTTITWDTDYRAVLGFIPSLNKTYNFHRITSPSYAKSYIYPLTKNNKIFILRDWGYPKETEIKDIVIIDPKNPEAKKYLSVYPVASADIAIVGDSIFYTDSIGYRSVPSLTGYTSVRASGGDLYKLDFDSTGSKKVLDYSDPDNTGSLYGIGDKLASVYLNPESDEFEFREHSTTTGKISNTFYTIPNVPDLSIYGGETGFYVVIKAPDLPNAYQIHQLKLNGDTKLLLNLELDSSSHYIEGVDEARGRLLISVSKTGVMDEIAVYGLDDDSFEVIPLDPDIPLLHPPSKGDRFIILNPG